MDCLYFPRPHYMMVGMTVPIIMINPTWVFWIHCNYCTIRCPAGAFCTPLVGSPAHNGEKLHLYVSRTNNVQFCALLKAKKSLLCVLEGIMCILEDRFVVSACGLPLLLAVRRDLPLLVLAMFCINVLECFAEGCLDGVLIC